MIDTINSGDPQIQIRKPLSWSLWDAFLIGVISILIIILGSWLLNYLPGFSLGQLNQNAVNSYYYTIILAALEGVGLLAGIIIALVLKRRKFSWQDLGIRHITSKWTLAAILTALILIPVIGLIAALIQYIFGVPLHNPQLDYLTPEEFTWLGATAMLFVGGFFVPVAEELFFRGILYQALRNYLGVVGAAIISAIIFGALHGELSIAISIFFMGLILAYFFERSGSIWPPIIIHIINNGLKLIFLFIIILLGYDISTF